MAQYKITVPLLSWLIGGSRIGGSYNTYIASLGTDAETGAVGKKIFNYRIFIEKNDNEEIIKVNCYFGMNSFENQNEDYIITNAFSMEEESLTLIEKWLQERAEDYFEREEQ